MESKENFLERVFVISPLLAHFPGFLTDETIPGHAGVGPALWLGRTVLYIVSENPDQQGLSAVEAIQRLFYSLVVVIAFLPVALFTVLIGLPAKAIAYAFFFDEPDDLEEESDPLMPPIFVQRIPPDGNCAFEAFLLGMRLSGHPVDVADHADFRKKTALWIAEHLPSDPDLQRLLLESVMEHYEVKQNWLALEEAQVLNFSDPSEEEGRHIAARLEAIPVEKEKIAHTLESLKQAADINSIKPLIDDYLEAVQKNQEEGRIYASRAHYYAFTRMFLIPITLEIYAQHAGNYNLIDLVKGADQTTLTLCFLHTGGDHIDLLIFP